MGKLICLIFGHSYPWGRWYPPDKYDRDLCGRCGKRYVHKSWCRILDIGGPCDCRGKPTREDWSAYHGR